MYSIKYPIAFHPVDIAILRTVGGKVQVLLAQKVKDSESGQNIWRFPGGFIDPWDSCAEESALREAMEETGMRFVESAFIDAYFVDKRTKAKEIVNMIESDIHPVTISAKIKEISDDKYDLSQSQSIKVIRSLVKYIGSTKIDDYRYKDTDHKVITSFYKINHMSGEDGEGPFDDIARTKWFNLSEIKSDDMHPAHKVLHQMLLEDQESELTVEKLYSTVNETIEKVKQDTEEVLSKVYDASKNALDKLFKRNG